MKKYLIKCIKLISVFPVLNLSLFLLYAWARKNLATKLTQLQGIKDVIIISDLSTGEFILGQSDFNLLVIAHNDYPTAKILKKLRQDIRGNILLNLVFNSESLPITTEQEIETSLLKSYLLKSYTHKMITWDSLIYNKKMTI